MREQSTKVVRSTTIRNVFVAFGLFGLLVSTEFLVNHTNWVPIPGSLARKPLTHQEEMRDKHHSSLPESLQELAGKKSPSVATESQLPLDLQEIDLPDLQSLERLGIRTSGVEVREMKEYVETTGVIDYDQTRVVKISSRVPGTVWRVEKEIGDQVRKGDLLAILEAARVGEAKSEFLQSVVQTRFRQATMDRVKKVNEVVTERQIREAEAALREARIKQVNSQQSLTNLGLPVTFQIDADLDEQALIRKIQFLGLPESIASALDPDSTPASLIPVTAPFDGVVTERNLSLGEVVESSIPLFSVADITKMWIILSVRKEDADRVRIDQPLSFQNDNSTADIQGMVQWISPEVNPESRTVEVRGEVENPFLTSGKGSPVSLSRAFVRNVSTQKQRRMQANTFGRGRIQVQSRKNSTVVPMAAVQSLDEMKIVFISGEDRLRYEPRKIRVGIQHDGYVEVKEGVKAGEAVVTSGSHVLKSELSLRRMQANGSQ